MNSLPIEKKMHGEVLSIWKKSRMRSIVNKIRLCVRKYLIYLENSDKKKRNGKEGIYARGGAGGRAFLRVRLISYLAHSWP